MIDQDCRHCKGWAGCPGNDWYSFGQIRWCPQQVFWILKHAYILEAGNWPDQPREGKSQVVPHEGYFVKAALVLAQVKYRLKWTGWRGRLLAEEAINREKMLYLSGDAKSALYYISGGKPRKRKFGAWLADRDYRKSDKNIVFLPLDKKKYI